MHHLRLAHHGVHQMGLHPPVLGPLSEHQCYPVQLCREQILHASRSTRILQRHPSTLKQGIVDDLENNLAGVLVTAANMLLECLSH